MEEAEGPELTVDHLTTRIMLINVAAIHVGPDIIPWYTSRAETFVRRLPTYASNLCCNLDSLD